MINAPQSVIDALESGNFQFANIVDVNLGDAYGDGKDLVLHLTDFGRSVSFNGTTYNHDNAMVEIDGITRKASTGSDKVDVVFSVTDETIVEAIVSRRYINKPTIIRRVLIDSNNQIIGGFAIPVRTAWGLAHSIDGDLEDRVITLSIDSQLGDLNEDNGWYTVSTSHNQRYPNDKIMAYSNTVMDEEDQKRYTTDFTGVINAENKPPALSVVYGYKHAKLVPLLRLTHRKTHTTYRHYFTTWIYAINIGDVEEIDLKSMTRDGEPFKPTIVNHQGYDVGGWSCRVRHLKDQDKPIRGNPDFNFFFEGMNGGEPARFDGMYGKGLTLLLVKNRNRDDWVKGAPEIKIPIRGTKVLDPRTGQYSASRNPALQYYDYLRNTQYGAGGRGITVSESSVIALANHFDVIPESAGNEGINSILIDVEVDTAKPLVDNMNIWIEGCRMFTSDYYGEFNIRVEGIAPVTRHYHEDDLLEYPEYESGDFTDRINQLTYTVKQLVPDTEDPEQMVEVTVEATFPEDGSDIHKRWLAEDANIPKFESSQLSHVTDLEQAYYWAMVDSRISRQPDELTIAVGATGWLHEAGDVISFTSPILEMDATQWRVVEVSEDDGKVELELKPYDPTFYTPAPDVVPSPIPPARPPVMDRLEAVNGLSAAVNDDEYVISWEQVEAPSGYWFQIDVLVDGVKIINEPTIYNTPYKFKSALIGQFTVEVTKLSATDESATATLAFAAIKPVSPIVDIVSGVDFVTLTPTLLNSGVNTRFRFYIAGEAVAEGFSFTHAELLPNTEYSYDVSTVSQLGESPKTSVTATTKASNEVFAEAPSVPNSIAIKPITAAVSSTWDYDNYIGHSHSSIYYQETGDADGTPSAAADFSKASLINTTPAKAATVPLGGMMSGYLFITNTNVNGLQSAPSAAAFAIPKKFVDTDEFDKVLDDLASVNTDLKLNIQTEVTSRKETDKALFDTAAAAANLRKDLDNGMAGLTDAIFEVDSSTGQIVLKAYGYTDDAFNQAGILIDGVRAEVGIVASRVTTSESRITNAESQILTQAGQISLKASYNEVNEIVAGAIDAILPVYTFGFFNSTEGWAAVNGTATASQNELNLTLGDIQNLGLNYLANDNPVISLDIERTGGSGWVGDMVVTFAGGATKTFTSAIKDIATGAPFVRVLNLGGDSSYSGTVTGIRFKLGASVSDTFTISNITIGKPSAAFESLEGIQAQVNQLGVEIDAVEGKLTNYVTTAFYDENSVTMNNVESVLDGTDAILSLKATQQQINENGVIDKANNAQIWIDGAESNITQVVTEYNAQAGGLNDQLDDINDRFTTVQSSIDATTGAISDQALAVNRLGNKDKDIEKNAFYAAEIQLRQKQGLLDAGENIALANRELQVVAGEIEALAQELLSLKSSTGSDIGQINAEITSLSKVVTDNQSATSTYINQLQADIDGNYETQSNLIQEVSVRVDGTADAIAGLNTKVENLEGDVSGAQLQLETTMDEVGELQSRAFLGTTSTSNGQTVVNGIVVDSSTNSIAFQTSAMSLIDLAGNRALEWDEASGTFVFKGRLVVGGYAVNSEADIRALDGDTIYEKYQYSINGASNWHDTLTTGDLYRRTATVTNGVVGVWSAAAKIAGNDGISITGVVNYYAKSANNALAPTSGWTTTVPTVDATNKYLWNYEEVSYTIGSTTKTPAAVIGTFGEKGIKTVTEYYLATSQGSGVTTSAGGWTTTIQTVTAVNKFLWNYEVTTYTDNSTSSTLPVIIGVYGDKGDKGDQGNAGVSVTGVINYYQKSSSATVAPTTWSTSVPTLDATNKYLWNYEQISYSSGAPTTTAPAMIGTLAADGSNGKGIVSITEYYLASASQTGVTTSTSGWTTTPQVTDTTKKYLWNYEVIKYTTGADTVTTPAIIGTHGATGDNGNPGAGMYGGEFPAIDWTTTTANSRFQSKSGRLPVLNDVFTQTNSTTFETQARQYNGSTWSNVAMFVDGSIVAKNTIAGDKIVAGTEITAPKIKGGEIIGGKISLIGTSFMKIEDDSGFGAEGLWYWFGLKKLLGDGSPDLSYATKANAQEWKDIYGNAYFGGSLSAGILKNGAQNTTITLYSTTVTPLEVGPFGTNGKSKTVVISYSCNAWYKQATDPGNVTTPEVLRWKVQRQINGTWTDVAGATGTITGTVFKDYDNEADPSNPYRVTYDCNGTGTFVDGNASTANTSYRVMILAHTRPFTNTIVKRQSLSLISTEQ